MICQDVLCPETFYQKGLGKPFNFLADLTLELYSGGRDIKLSDNAERWTALNSSITLFPT